MDNDPRDWEGIKRDYVEGDWSLARIAEKGCLSVSTLTRRAKREGWVRKLGTRPLRRQRAAQPSSPQPERKPAPKAKPVPKPKPRAASRRRIVERLFKALDEKMRQIEQRMAETQGEGALTLSAADAERDARTLSGLARLYAKLVELDDRTRAGAGGTEAGGKNEAPDDADRLRRELALRLQRLNQARNA